MVFDSVSALLAMDGHGPYVWFSYGASVLVLVGLIISAAQRRRAAVARIRAMLRREQASERSNH